MIPKIIHYVWVGAKPLPDSDRVRIDAWQAMHPDWEIRFWGNSHIDLNSQFVRKAYAAKAWNRVANYTRADALAKFGGVYLDTDIELRRPLDDLLHHRAFVGFQAGDDLSHEMVNNAVFAAESGHWLPLEIRDYLETKIDGGVDVGSFSGPGVLTLTLKQHGLSHYCDEPVTIDDVTIMPRRYFYPYLWTEAFSEDLVTKDTYAIHHWAATWVKKQTAWSKLIEKVKRKSQALLSLRP